MKWFIYIALFISIGANSYFIYDEFQVKQNEEFGRIMNRAMGGELSKTNWKDGLKLFTDKLKQENKTLADKKYIYINIWTSWCVPCIKEMPWLDSIAGTLKKDVAYVFVSDLTDKAADNCIKNKNYNIKNFIFLNDMSHFVDAICNEQGRKSKAYPMVLILSNDGKLLHYSIGAYENIKEAAEFVEMINKLG
jgi:thiol-disulfide isomerase/thioredoxin